jgi:cbb3-type cytochrome oxidase maturation protein
MEVLFVLIPVSVALATASVVACLVAIRGGQYDDMESPRWRMLFDPSKSPGGRGAEPGSKAGGGEIAEVAEKTAEVLVNEEPGQKNPGARIGANTRRSNPI